MNETYDLFLNIQANPNFSISDFKLAGFNIDNTVLESEEKYKKSAKVLQMFSDKDGKFNEKKLHDAYVVAANVYGELSNDKYVENIIKLTTFHRDNIFAPASQRRQGPDFVIELRPNPLRDTSSMTRLGVIESSPLSLSEIAQTQKVLANPTQAYNSDGTINLKKAIWHDSPNDSFFTDFWDTRVLAAWDSDGLHINPITGKKEKHTKGDLKLNSNGTYFYENLDGRDVYGKLVLNKLNTITRDGSNANRYDFFDSDGKEEKSIAGTTLKNMALVGSMFIPYVGTGIAAASVLYLSAGFLATLGKMLTSSDNATLSAIEGWTKSINRQTAKSEYALSNMWCWENFIDLVGDSIALFREQRVLFELVPRLIKGNYVLKGKEGEKAFKALEAKKYDTYDQMLSKVISKEKDRSIWQKRLKELTLAKDSKINKAWDKYLEDYYHLGGILSKSYMTALTVSDTYGEAKLAGASDIEAALLTLGYGAAEAALLNTGVGEWLFPELRYNKMRQQAVMEAAIGAKKLTKTYEELGLNAATLAGKELKKSYVKDVFSLGKNALRSLTGKVKSTPAKVLELTMANALGEGTEEVTEEVLADVSKGIFNLYSWLTGLDKHILTNWRDKDGNWTLGLAWDDYAMNFLGGFVGGGIAGLDLKNIQAIRGLDQITHEQALLEIAYMIRNNKIDDFVRAIDKADLGDKHLSTLLVLDETGNMVYAPGTKSDNLDSAAKAILKNNINIMRLIMDSEGISMSDDSFLAQQTELLKDVKLSFLLNSITAGKLLLDYNTNVVELIKLHKEHNEINNNKSSDSAELSDDLKGKLKKIDEEIKLRQETIKDMLGGKRTALYASAALFEMSPAISEAFVLPTFLKFVEYVEHRPYDKVSLPKIESWKKVYAKIQEIDNKDLYDVGSLMYMAMSSAATDVVAQHALQYEQSLNDPAVLALTNALTDDGLFTITNDVTISESNDEWLANALKTIQGQTPAVIRKLLTALGVDLTPSNNLLMQWLQLKEDLTIPEDEKNIKEHELIEQENEFISENLFNKIEEITNPFITQGYINSEQKNVLLKVINEAEKYFDNIMSPLEKEEQEDLEYVAAIDPDSLSELDKIRLLELQEKSDRLTYAKTFINNIELLIESLQHTPIELFLTTFSGNVFGRAINFSELIQKVNTVIKDKFDKDGNFSTNNFNISTLLEDIKYALNTIKLYKTALLGAQTENGDLDNAFGFNKTLNEIHKTLGINDYQELAEIDYNTAQILQLDASMLEEKLLFARQLHAISLGLKLALLERVASNVNYLIYNKMLSLSLAGLPDDWEDKEGKLRLTLDNMKLHAEKAKLFDKNLTSEQEEQLLKEYQLLEDAIYEFFLNNKDKDLSKLLFKIGGESLLTDPDILLTEETSDLDDNSFIWWLCAHAAVKASDFYTEYFKTLDGSVAPLKTLMIATYNNYASIINGLVYDKFFDAYRKAIINYFVSLSEEDKIKFVKEHSGLKTDEKIKEKIKDPFKILGLIEVPRFSNIIFTEGIPGSGKTKAVLDSTIKMLKNHKDADKLLRDVRVVHAASLGSAKELLGKNGLNLDSNKSTAYNHDMFLKYIFSEWKDLYIDPSNPKYYRTPDLQKLVENEYGEAMISVQPNATTFPSLIIIDEISNFNLYELDLINTFAKEQGITILGCGDLDLTSFEGVVELDENQYGIGISRLNFIRSPKLGISMRTSNNLKNANFARMRTLQENPKSKVELHYYEDERGLYGDKVLLGEVGLTTTEYYLLLKLELLRLIDTRRAKGDTFEKIGYIYDDTSNFKTLVERDFQNVFEFFKGNEAQGREALYYIIDVCNSLLSRPETWTKSDERANKKFIKFLYTGISRSEQGSLIIDTIGSSTGKTPLNTSILDDGTINEGFTSEQIKAYADKFKKLLSNSLMSNTSPEYIPRREAPKPPQLLNLPEYNNQPLPNAEAPEANQQELQQQESEESQQPVVYSQLQLADAKTNAVSWLATKNITTGTKVRNTLTGNVVKIVDIKEGTPQNLTPILIFDNGTSVQFSTFLSKFDNGTLKIAKETWVPSTDILKNVLNSNEFIININGTLAAFNLVDITVPESQEYEATTVKAVSKETTNGFVHEFKILLKGTDIIVNGNHSEGRVHLNITNTTLNPQQQVILDSVLSELNTIFNNVNSSKAVGPIYNEYNDVDSTFDEVLDTLVSVNTEELETLLLEDIEDLVDDGVDPNLDFVSDDDLNNVTDLANENELQKEEIVQPVASILETIQEVEDVGTLDTSTGKLQVDFLSFSAFELGVKIKQGSNGDIPVQSADVHNTPGNVARDLLRIDSVNGLINLYKSFYVTAPTMTIDKYVEALELLHKLAETTTDNTVIATLAAAILKKFLGKDITGLTAGFGVVSTIYPSKHDRSGNEYIYQGKEIVNNYPNANLIFDRSKNDLLRYVNSDAINASQPLRSHIDLIIADNTGKPILLIPVLNFPNPFTLLRGMNDLNLLNILEVIKNWIDNTGIFAGQGTDAVIRYVITELQKFGANYLGLIDLFDYYYHLENFIVPFDALWNPMRNMKSSGLKLLSYAKINSTHIEPELKTMHNNKPKALSDVKHNRVQLCPKILYSLTGEIRLSDDSIIKVNAGMPFILVNYGGNHYTTALEMLNRYKFEQLDKSLIPTIRLVYVNPPKVDVKEYLHTLVNIVTRKGSNHLKIGSKNTVFNILVELFSNKPENQQIREHLLRLVPDFYKIDVYGDSTSEPLFFKRLNECINVYNLEGPKKVTELLLRNNNEYKNYFLKMLVAWCYSVNSSVGSYALQSGDSAVYGNLNAIADYLHNTSLGYVRLSADRDYADKVDYSDGIHSIKHDEDYNIVIGGSVLSYTMNPNLNTPKFTIDDFSTLYEFIKSHVDEKSGKWQTAYLTWRDFCRDRRYVPSSNSLSTGFTPTPTTNSFLLQYHLFLGNLPEEIRQRCDVNREVLSQLDFDAVKQEIGRYLLNILKRPYVEVDGKFVVFDLLLSLGKDVLSLSNIYDEDDVERNPIIIGSNKEVIGKLRVIFIDGTTSDVDVLYTIDGLTITVPQQNIDITALQDQRFKPAVLQHFSTMKPRPRKVLSNQWAEFESILQGLSVNPDDLLLYNNLLSGLLLYYTLQNSDVFRKAGKLDFADFIDMLNAINSQQQQDLCGGMTIKLKSI